MLATSHDVPQVPAGPENVTRTFAVEFAAPKMALHSPTETPTLQPRCTACRPVHQRDRTGERSGIGRVLRLAAAHPHHAHVDHERAEREQRQQREGDVDDDRATLTLPRVNISMSVILLMVNTVVGYCLPLAPVALRATTAGLGDGRVHESRSLHALPRHRPRARTP